MRITLFDCLDSFTWNLVHDLERAGARVRVVEEGQWQASDWAQTDALVLSPGPGLPEEHPQLLDVLKEAALDTGFLDAGGFLHLVGRTQSKVARERRRHAVALPCPDAPNLRPEGPHDFHRRPHCVAVRLEALKLQRDPVVVGVALVDPKHVGVAVVRRHVPVPVARVQVHLPVAVVRGTCQSGQDDQIPDPRERFIFFPGCHQKVKHIMLQTLIYGYWQTITNYQ